MASYRAAATGNWSALATWQVWSGTAWVAATSVPGSADDVWANGQTVTINQDITVLTLRNSSTGAPGTGNVTSGGFVVSSGSWTVTVSNTITQTMIQSTSGVVLLSLTTTGTVTLNMSVVYIVGTNPVVGSCLRINGPSVVNINGDIFTRKNSANITDIDVNSATTVNFTGNIGIQGGNGTTNNHILSFNIAGWVFNLTGNIIIEAGANIGATTPSSVVRAASNGTINMTGDCINNSYGNATTSTLSCILSTTVCTVNITGNIIPGGGASFGLANGVTLADVSTINHIGACYGGDVKNIGNGTGIGGVAISNQNGQSTTICSGPFIFGNYGTPPFVCARLFLSNNTSKYTEFASNSTNGALFPSAAPTRQTMYSPNTLSDAPVPANVRFGVVYASGSQTGTLRVPNPGSVALGVLTDDTVGTAVLTQANVKQAVWDALLTDLTTPNSIGVRLKNAATVDSTGDQIANLVNT